MSGKVFKMRQDEQVVTLTFNVGRTNVETVESRTRILPVSRDIDKLTRGNPSPRRRRRLKRTKPRQMKTLLPQPRL